MLPLLGQFSLPTSRRWKKWELPAAGAVPGGSPAPPLKLLVSYTDRASEEVEVQLAGGLLIPRDAEREDSTSQWVEASRQAHAVCSIHVETASECYDERSPSDEDWSGFAEGRAVRDWATLLRKWLDNKDTEEPRLALIVKIAQQFGGRLEALCRTPRRVLRRVRAFERPGRVRQLDSACVRWLTRQPGRDHVERCGPKQRLLAVVRTENSDTPENRVAKDFLYRARRACQDYVFENSLRREKQRIRDVERFRVLLDRLLVETEIGTASGLVGPPEPNYVLLYDPRYRELWHWYQRLRRQQMDQDNIWQWRHRVWAETCQLAFGQCLEVLQSESVGLGSVAATSIEPLVFARSQLTGPSSLVYLRNEQDAGRFIDPRSPIGPWQLQVGEKLAFVHLVPGDQLSLFSARFRGFDPLESLSPDFVLVSHLASQEPHEGAVVPVWSELDFGLGGDRVLGDRVDEICVRVDAMLPGRRLQGILVQPRLPADGTDERIDVSESLSGSGACCIGFGFPGPLQRHLDWLQLALSPLLDPERR